MGVVRSGFVQIGGALVVGVAGRTHQHTQCIDNSGILEQRNPQKVYPLGRRVYALSTSSPFQFTYIVDSALGTVMRASSRRCTYTPRETR